MLTPLIIWGASGHALVVADAVRKGGKYCVIGFLDDINSERRGEAFSGSFILGGREYLEQLTPNTQICFFIAIGNCAARMSIASDVRRCGFRLATIIHPNATVAQDTIIDDGTMVAAGTVVNSGVMIGSNVIVNTGACVDHECLIADGVHIGPGARLGGRVKVSRGAWIGIGAAIRDRVTIGEAAMVGMGAVVVNDIPPHVTVYGVPARIVDTSSTT